MIDNRTPNYSWPLIHPDNDQEDDVPRLLLTLLQIDALIASIQLDLALISPEAIGALPVAGTAVAAERLATARRINGVLFNGTADIDIEDGGAERRLPELPEADQAGAYLTGARTWAPLAAAVLGATLTGLGAGPATPIAATDTVLQALAKLQAQAGNVRPVHDAGSFGQAGADTVTIDVSTHEDTVVSLNDANTTGALTVQFDNVPDVASASAVWYVEFIRGGRKSITWTLPAGLSLVWAGGVAPTLSNVIGSRDMIMFERRLGRSQIVGTLIASGSV